MFNENSYCSGLLYSIVNRCLGIYMSNDLLFGGEAAVWALMPKNKIHEEWKTVRWRE